MLILYGDDGAPRRRPWVNWGLLILNVLVFIAVTALKGDEEHYRRIVLPHGLVPAEFSWGDVFTAMFLHANSAHLLFNMLFLYVVGDVVEDLLGHAGYLACYVAAGIGAALWYAWSAGDGPGSGVPCIGASGAVAGVLAMAVVLRPKMRSRFAFVFPWFGPPPWIVRPLALSFTARSIAAVAYWLALQLAALAVLAVKGTPGGLVPGAHLGGLASGLVIAGAIGLAGFGDLGGFGLVRWVIGERCRPDSLRPDGWTEAERPAVRSRLDALRPERPRPAPAPDTPAALLRAVQQALATDDPAAAAEAYLRFREASPGEALDAASQFRVAEHFREAGFASEAAEAYGAFLRAYPTSSRAPEAELRAGALAAERGAREEATARLEKALEGLRDEGLRKAASDELAKLQR